MRAGALQRERVKSHKTRRRHRLATPPKKKKSRLHRGRRPKRGNKKKREDIPLIWQGFSYITPMSKAEVGVGERAPNNYRSIEY